MTFRQPRLALVLGLVGALVVAPDSSLAAATREAGLLVPGGTALVRALLGMPASTAGLEDEPFVDEVLEFLDLPGRSMQIPRLLGLLDELGGLQELSTRLEQAHGTDPPSFAEIRTAGYAKATAIAEYFGLRPQQGQRRLAFEELDKEQFVRRRRLLDPLGLPPADNPQAWEVAKSLEIDAQDQWVGLLFDAEVWRQEVLGVDVDDRDLLSSLLRDSAARNLLLGYYRLDDETRRLLFDEVGLEPLYRDAEIGNRFSGLAVYLRSDAGRLFLPGGDEIAWRSILGGWENTTDLLRRLLGRHDAKATQLWRALSLIPEARANYLLTLGSEDPGARRQWASRLYGAIRVLAGGRALHWRGDLAELFSGLRLRSDGLGIAWPGGGASWRAALHKTQRIRDREQLEVVLSATEDDMPEGREADAWVLLRLVRGPGSRDYRPTTIERFLTVVAAMRYQEQAMNPRTVALLYTNLELFGPAYSFFVMPAKLASDTVERLLLHLLEIERIPSGVELDNALRQLQSTLLLMQRLLTNGVIEGSEADRLLGQLVRLPFEHENRAFNIVYLASGSGLTGWWRDQLLPLVADKMAARDSAIETRLASASNASHEVVPVNRDATADPDAVLHAGLRGSTPGYDFEIAGVPYRYDAAADFDRLMRANLAQQGTVPLAPLLRFDAVAQRFTGLTDEQLASRSGEVADDLRQSFDELRASAEEAIFSGEADDIVPVPIARRELQARVQEVFQSIDRGEVEPRDFDGLRRAAAAMLGDRLISLVYALSISDPEALYFRDRRLSWRHRMDLNSKLEAEHDIEAAPWLPTREVVDPVYGRILCNSLFGLRASLGQWTLRLETLSEDLPYGSGSVADTWGNTLGYLEPGSPTLEAQTVITRRHATATEWILQAATARDPDLRRPAEATGGAPTVPRDSPLRRYLAYLAYPRELQTIVAALKRGDADGALALVTPGNRYLLGRMAEGALDSTASSWEDDQAVGMTFWRGNSYLGLTHPPMIPYGEASDLMIDPLLFARLLDVRVALALAIASNELPPTLHARLLPRAMGAVLSHIRPQPGRVWAALATAIPLLITKDSVWEWVVDMAFEDQLTPREPQ